MHHSKGLLYAYSLGRLSAQWRVCTDRCLYEKGKKEFNSTNIPKHEEFRVKLRFLSWMWTIFPQDFLF